MRMKMKTAKKMMRTKVIPKKLRLRRKEVQMLHHQKEQRRFALTNNPT